MPVSQADIDALEAALIASGGASVLKSGNEETRFETITERLKLISVLQSRVDRSGGATRTRFAATSKGL